MKQLQTTIATSNLAAATSYPTLITPKPNGIQLQTKFVNSTAFTGGFTIKFN